LIYPKETTVFPQMVVARDNVLFVRYAREAGALGET